MNNCEQAVSCGAQVAFDDCVGFVLDQYAMLDFNSASSPKQQCGHVAPFRHMILIPSQSVFVLAPWC